ECDRDDSHWLGGALLVKDNLLVSWNYNNVIKVWSMPSCEHKHTLKTKSDVSEISLINDKQLEIKYYSNDRDYMEINDFSISKAKNIEQKDSENNFNNQIASDSLEAFAFDKFAGIKAPNNQIV